MKKIEDIIFEEQEKQKKKWVKPEMKIMTRQELDNMVFVPAGLSVEEISDLVEDKEKKSQNK